MQGISREPGSLLSWTLWSNVNKTTFLVRSCTLEVGTKYHGGYMVCVVRWNIFEKTWCFLEIAIRSVWLRCIMGVEGREVNRGNIVTKFLWSKVKDLFFILRVLCSERLKYYSSQGLESGGWNWVAIFLKMITYMWRKLSREYLLDGHSSLCCHERWRTVPPYSWAFSKGSEHLHLAPLPPQSGPGVGYMFTVGEFS